MDLDQQYMAAFSATYPQKTVAVRRRFNKQGQFVGFQVAIDGDWGDMILTTNDMREAIRNFNR